MARRRKGGREESQNVRGWEKVRPPDERKNPDWSDFMNYLIHPSDWSASCHSNPLSSNLPFTFNNADTIKRSFLLIHHILADVSNNASFENY